MSYETLKKTTICSHWQASGVCPFGEKCTFAHGTNELRTKAAAIAPHVNGGYAPARVAYQPAQSPVYSARPPISYGASYAPPAAPVRGPRTELRKTKMCRNMEQTGTCQFADGCSYAHSAAELQAFPPRASQPYAAYAAPVVYAPAPTAYAPRGTRTDLHKTKMCRNLEQTGTCHFGDRCAYAHSETELHQPPPRTEYVAAAPYYPAPAYQSTRYQPSLKRPIEQVATSFPPAKRPMRSDLYKTAMCVHFTSTNSCPFGEACVYAHGEAELRQKNAPVEEQPPQE